MGEKIILRMNKILEALEIILAALILLVLLAMIGIEVSKLVCDPSLLLAEDFLDQFLGSVTTLVVAVEFVKMLLRPTASNTLELLIMAISRYVVLNHHNHVAIAVGIAGVVALFATRRFLISKKAAREMDEAEARMGAGSD